MSTDKDLEVAHTILENIWHMGSLYTAVPTPYRLSKLSEALTLADKYLHRASTKAAVTHTFTAHPDADSNGRFYAVSRVVIIDDTQLHAVIAKGISRFEAENIANTMNFLLTQAK